MLQELAKQDDKWRSIAFMICKDKMLADDLVQEMYLKVKDYKKINSYFVAVTLKNLFLNHIKQKKEVRLAEADWLEDYQRNFEPTDEEQRILDNLKDINWRRQEFIAESYDRSYREIARIYPFVNYAYARRETLRGIKEILGEDYFKYYKIKD